MTHTLKSLIQRMPFYTSLRRTQLYTTLGLGLMHARAKLFDLKHGVNTSSAVNLHQLKVDNANLLTEANRYEGSDEGFFNVILSTLPINHKGFTFVDFGSGKGKAILLASEYPFKKVIGVEFSPRLHGIAEENIRKYKSASQKCRDISSVCMDAAKFPIPDVPAVLYFYSPFRGELLASACNNIEGSLRKNPRELYVIATGPEYGLRQFLDHSNAFTRIVSSEWYNIYRSGVASS